MDSAEKAFEVYLAREFPDYPDDCMDIPAIDHFLAGYASRDAEVARLRGQLEKIAALEVPDLPKEPMDREIALGAIFGVAIMLANDGLATVPGGTITQDGEAKT